MFKIFLPLGPWETAFSLQEEHKIGRNELLTTIPLLKEEWKVSFEFKATRFYFFIIGLKFFNLPGSTSFFLNLFFNQVLRSDSSAPHDGRRERLRKRSKVQRSDFENKNEFKVRRSDLKN